MITHKNRIHRRTLLKGAGGMALGLPFLSAMLRPGKTHAQGDTPVRLIVFYNPGGTLLNSWRPTGSETSFSLSPMMSPLSPYLDRLVFVDGLGLDITRLGSGHPHSRGMGGVLTGQQLLPGNYNTNGGNAGFAAGPSIDQVIAASNSSGLRFPSLEVSAGWSTGIASGGQPHPGNIINYQPPAQPGQQAVAVPPATDPLNALNRVFAGLNGDADTAARAIAWNTSILDGVRDDFNRVRQQLGAEDRARLDAHAALVRETEEGLRQAVDASCETPTSIDPTPGFYDDPIAEGVSRGNSDGGNASITTGMKVPLKGEAMTNLLVGALACDLTRVGTMQWSDSEAKFMLGFLQDANGQSLKDHHHGYQHDRGFQAGSLEVIYHFYMEKLAYLLQKLDSVDEGDGTLLDNSLVLSVSEIQMPETHAQDNMPFLLAGKAGGRLQTQRWLRVRQQPHNNLLVSILNLFGVPEQTFGHPDFCTGPLVGLV